MFRLFFGSDRGGTCRPVKNHVPGSKREMMSDITLKTLGSGDLIGAVKLPAGEDQNEWLAANTVDFFNEIRLIWDIVAEMGVGDYQVGRGFPPGFEYRWAESKASSPITCTGPQYVDYVLEWAEKELNNVQLFPTSSSSPFPKTFLTSVKQIFTKFFRIYAIIYSHHFSKLEQAGAVSHLNTSFKHLLLFIWEYNLVQPNEFDALKDIVKEIRLRYGIEDKPVESSYTRLSFLSR
eukprot:gene7881-8521_t